VAGVSGTRLIGRESCEPWLHDGCLCCFSSVSSTLGIFAFVCLIPPKTALHFLTVQTVVLPRASRNCCAFCSSDGSFR
jgi:hypothetical protein